MSIFAITYDLNEDKDYNKLIKELKRLECHKAALSFWLGNIDGTTKEVLDHLKGYIDDDDTLIVVKTSVKDIKTYRARKGTKEWLADNA